MGITQFVTSASGIMKPTVSAGTATTSSMPLSWTSVSGATAYDLWETNTHAQVESFIAAQVALHG